MAQVEQETIPSVLGRLLVELSWEGEGIREYRDGGQGKENVLSADALAALDFLPRSHFLASIFRNLHGGSLEAKERLAQEAEGTVLHLLPGSFYLRPSAATHQEGIAVQPDGLVDAPSVFGFLEAKRIRESAFQAQQLARTISMTVREARGRTPLAVFILGEEPPVRVRGLGRMGLVEGTRQNLDEVLGKLEDFPWAREELDRQIEDLIAWITWEEIETITRQQLESFTAESPSVQAAIERLAGQLLAAVEWHS